MYIHGTVFRASASHALVLGGHQTVGSTKISNIAGYIEGYSVWK